MDYDDNDFQSQNFQLVGEDISKFSSGLKSFSLPGFDPDDHLQVHLRYDSLVETGNLLGITGQEDTNWIDNFSSGNSATEFSSSAVKSHSISRNDYVWTGAPSSESVEMSLKSVGEDYMMEKNAITKQSDSENLLNSLSNSTGACLNKIDPADPKLETLIYADSTPPSEKSQNILQETPKDVVNAVYPGSIGCHISVDKKHLSEGSRDIVGGLLSDVVREKLISPSAFSCEDSKVRGELAVRQRCQQRSQEESFGKSPSNDYLDDDISKISVDSTHLDDDQVVVDSSFTADKTDVLTSEQAHNQKLTELVIVDQEKIESECFKTDDPLLEVSKEKSFGVLNKVSNFVVDSDEAGKECSSKPSSLLEEFDSSAEIVNTCNGDFHREQVDLICVHDREKLNSSSMIMNATQETNNNQNAGIIDEKCVSMRNEHKKTDKSDAKQLFEMRKPEEQGAEESASIFVDDSVGSQITSSATVCEVYVNKSFDEEMPELSEDAIAASELVKDKVSIEPCLPASHTILSDRDVGKSSQLSTGLCLNVLDRCSNLKTATLGDSEPIVLGTSGQPSCTMSKDLSSQSHTRVSIIPDNGSELSSNRNASLGLVMDEKGHPMAVIAEEDKENCQSEKLPFQDSKELTPSVSGNVHHSTEYSRQCINLFENTCDSPTIISSNQHIDENMDDQGNDRGACNLTQSFCTSNFEKSSWQMESTGRNPKESNSLADDKSFTFEVAQFSEHCEHTLAKGWKPFSSSHSSEETALKSGNDSHSNVIGNASQGSHLIFEGVKLQDAVIKSAVRSKYCSKPATGSASRWKTKEKSVSNKIDSSGTKLLRSPVVQVSKLPDLNSASTTPVFNQPFTNSQQVQLRAQIFVYGSLIQGIPPDEGCMMPAFGGVDGERGKWEGIWRTLAEKYDCQKSPLAAETPSSSAVKALDQIPRNSALQSKVMCTQTVQITNEEVHQASQPPRQRSKNDPSHATHAAGVLPAHPCATIFSPISPPPPVWSMSTRDKLHSNTSQSSNLDSNLMFSPSFPYQSPNARQYTSNVTPWPAQSPFPVSWVASQTSAGDTGIHYSVPSITETVQYMSNKDPSLPHSTIQFKSSSAFLTTGSALNASVPLLPAQIDPSKGIAAPSKSLSSADQKSRRKKKSGVPETTVQLSSVFKHQQEVNPTVGVRSLVFTSPNANPSSSATSGSYASTISPLISPTHFQVEPSSTPEPKIILSEKTCSKIGQAKLQAEDAAAFAASAVQHCQGVWNQLAIQQSSGTDSNVVQNLASASVAAAAAAAAAVAVAKAASAVAKLAADSAFHAKLMADEAVKFDRSGKVSHCSESVELSNGNNLPSVAPASILKGKGESKGSYSIIPAAREAARRRLEEASAANRRAENLDAIVKAAELAAEAVSQANSIVAMGDPLPLTLTDLLERGPDSYGKAQHSEVEQVAKSMHGETQLVNKLSSGEKDLQQTAVEESGRSSTELFTRSIENHTDGKDQSAGENVIKEGTLVEVKSDIKGVWYSARVLDLKDAKAYVCYNELLHDKGSDKVKEWICLDSECGGAPRIRSSHPKAAKKSDVTRKRRRSGAGTLMWDVGDRVDAWINEGWREGVITEKSEEDASKFVINFPAGGDSSVFRSWDLRPSLVWEDKQWIEWRSSRKHLGDTPEQKRHKISKSKATFNSEKEAVGVSRVSSNISSHNTRKPEGFIPLPLSAKERVFSFGKATGEENKSDRIKRTGLQKEGSRVVFGIPKPGKKRKFMDVSKQCVVDNAVKGEEGSKSGKFTKYLMPQSSTGWQNTTKVDSRIKRAVEPKSEVPRSSKSQNVQARNLSDKGSTSISISGASGGENRGTMGSKPLASHVDKFEKKQFLEIDSAANSKGAAEGPTSVSHPSSKSSSEDKGSNLPDDSKMPDASEPRRSSRRIQPTSRLLEGLQSSLIIGKVPSLPHDKGSKSIT